MQEFLDLQLGAPIGVDGRRGMLLVVGKVVRGAVDGGARTEHQPVHTGGLHGLQQVDGALHVVGVVVDGPLDRLADRLEAREVDDGLDGMALKGVPHQGGITHIALDEDRPRARQGSDAVDHVGLAVAEVVEQNDLVSGLDQRHGRMAADVAGAAGEKHMGLGHAHPFMRCASHSENWVPTSGWVCARSTVACRKPSLLPQS